MMTSATNFLVAQKKMYYINMYVYIYIYIYIYIYRERERERQRESKCVDVLTVECVNLAEA